VQLILVIESGFSVFELLSTNHALQITLFDLLTYFFFVLFKETKSKPMSKKRKNYLSSTVPQPEAVRLARLSS
jgi:hypothetical protein